MAVWNDDSGESKVSHDTLIRLANSCEREAGRGKLVLPTASDLNEEDLRTIAEILRTLAATIGNEGV